MSDMWLDLLPILLALLISPARTLALILLLHSPRHAVTAGGYVVGMVTAMLAQGIVLAAGFALIGLTSDERSGDLKVVVGVLFVVAGIIMLVGASRFVFAAEDDDGPPPGWLEKLEHITPRQAATTGFGWLMVSPKQWVFVLTAIAVIFAADLPPAGSLVNYVVFALLVQGAYLIIIAVYLLAPQRSARILDGVFAWLKLNLRAVAITVFAGFGLIFLVKGLSALAG
jgi:hypothetical protein